VFYTTIFEPPSHLITPVTGDSPAKEDLSVEARVAMALRLLHGGLPIADSAIARAAYLCGARRAKVGEHLKRHRDVAKAFAKAFMRATAEDRDAFIRSIGCGKIWNALTTD
jgi:hypothetical protein